MFSMKAALASTFFCACFSTKAALANGFFLRLSRFLNGFALRWKRPDADVVPHAHLYFQIYNGVVPVAGDGRPVWRQGDIDQSWHLGKSVFRQIIRFKNLRISRDTSFYFRTITLNIHIPGTWTNIRFCSWSFVSCLFITLLINFFHSFSCLSDGCGVKYLLVQCSRWDLSLKQNVVSLLIAGSRLFALPTLLFCFAIRREHLGDTKRKLHHSRRFEVLQSARRPHQ